MPSKKNEKLWPVTLSPGTKARIIELGGRREPRLNQADVVREALRLWIEREARYQAAAARLGLDRAQVNPHSLLLAIELEKRGQTLAEALEANGGELPDDLLRVLGGR